MSKWIGIAAAFLVATTIYAGADSPESLVKEHLKNTKDAIDLLSAIKDKKSADAAKPKLNDLNKRMADLDRKRRVLGTASDRTMDELKRKYEKSMKALDAALNKEFARLEKLPASWGALENTPFASLVLAKRDEAQAFVLQLTEAVQTYKSNYQEYPATLKALAQKKAGVEPLLDEKALLDPWGRPYRYDVKGPLNKGQMPDLWSQGPVPNDPAGMIGNWTPVRKKTEPKK